MCPPPPAPHTKCTWPTLFICMRMFSLRCCHQAIWMGSLHSDSPVTEYDWGQAGLSRSAGVYIIVCVVEQHDLLVQCEGFTLLQVCVLSLMRLICHRCLRGCVCVCVFVHTYLRMVIYAIGLEQKRPFLISSRNRQEVLYFKCVCECLSECVRVCVCVWPKVFSLVLWSRLEVCIPLWVASQQYGDLACATEVCVGVCVCVCVREKVHSSGLFMSAYAAPS